MRKLLTIACLFLVTLSVLIGCNLIIPAQTLSIYNWSTYIDPQVVKEFEDKFGVEIRYDTFDSIEQLYAKLKPGNPGYDIIFPSDYMVTILAKENLLEELNLNNIPNITNLDAKFLNAPFDPGNKYSIPYQWGTIGFGYNIKKTGTPIDSWKEAFSDKYQQQVALVEETRSVMGGVLIYLGYNPNTTNPQEILAAKNFLIEHKGVIAAFAADNGQQLLDQGDVNIVLEWSGDIFQVMAENRDLRYAIPKEGSIVWIDNMAIAKGAPHKNLAEKFINFLLEPEISAKISNFIKYGSPNRVAIDKKLIDSDLLNNPGIYPPPEVFAKLVFLKDVGASTKLYDQAWNDMKAAISN